MITSVKKRDRDILEELKRKQEEEQRKQIAAGNGTRLWDISDHDNGTSVRYASQPVQQEQTRTSSPFSWKVADEVNRGIYQYNNNIKQNNRKNDILARLAEKQAKQASAAPAQINEYRANAPTSGNVFDMERQNRELAAQQAYMRRLEEQQNRLRQGSPTGGNVFDLGQQTRDYAAQKIKEAPDYYQQYMQQWMNGQDPNAIEKPVLGEVRPITGNQPDNVKLRNILGEDSFLNYSEYQNAGAKVSDQEFASALSNDPAYRSTENLKRNGLTDDEIEAYKYIAVNHSIREAEEFNNSIREAKKAFGGSFDTADSGTWMPESERKQGEIPELNSISDVKTALESTSNVARKREILAKFFDAMDPETLESFQKFYDNDNAYEVALASVDTDPYNAMPKMEQSEAGRNEALNELRERLNVPDEDLPLYTDYFKYYNDYKQNEAAQAEINENLHTGNTAQDVLAGIRYTGESIIKNPVAGLQAAASDVVNKAFGNTRPELGTNPYDLSRTTLNEISNIRGAVQNRIAESGTTGAKIGSKAYGIGTSVADSAVNMGIAGLTGLPAYGFAGRALSTATFGLNAYETTLQEGLERGLTEKKAQTLAVVSGLAEMVTEEWSLDKMWDLTKGSSRLARNYLVDWLAQGGIEASEELASSVIYQVADRLGNADQSEYWDKVRAYTGNGMSLEQAKAQASKDTIMEIAEEGFAGGASGLLMGGGAVGINISQTNAAAKQAYNNNNLIESAQALSQNESDYRNRSAYESAVEAANKAQELIARRDAGENISNKELRELYWNVNDALNTEAQTRQEKKKSLNVPQAEGDDEFVRRAVNFYAGENNNIDVDEIVPAMANAETAEELVELRKAAENAEQSAAKSAAMSAFELNKSRLMSEENQTAEDFEKAEKSISTSEAFNQAMKGEKEPEGLTGKAKAAFNTGRQVYLINQSKSSVNESVKGAEVNLEDGSTAKLTGEISGFGDNAKVKTDKGSIDINDIQDNALKALYSQAARQNGETAAQVYLNNYAAGTPFGLYDNAFSRYYAAGATNTRTFEELYKDDLIKKYVSVDALRNIYQFGADEGELERQQNIIRAGMPVAEKGHGKVHDLTNGEISEDRLKLAELVAGINNLDVYIGHEWDKNVNGYLDRAVGAMFVNADASDSVYTNTMFHEGFGEFIKAHNIKGYEQIQQELMQFMADDDFSKFVKDTKQYQRAYQNQLNKDGKNEIEGFYESASEYINDGIAGLFSSEEGVQALVDHYSGTHTETETKTFFQMVGDFFKSVADAIRSLINGGNLSAASMKTAQMSEQKARDIRQMILDAAGIAAENAQNAEIDVNAKSGIAYSLNTEVRNKLGKNADIVTDENGNLQVASSDKSNSVVFNASDVSYSLKTLNNTQKRLAEVLKAKGHTQEEIDYAIDMIQRQADLLQDVSAGYMEMGEALQQDIITDIKGGKQVIRSLVKNGEYPVNVDFMTICKKRQAYMKVLTDLIDDGTFASVSYSPEAIVDVNNILRMNEYETACLGCFVESRRLQIQKWAESFVDAWNRQVAKALDGKEAKPFNFGKNERGTTSLTEEEINKLHEEFEAGGKKNAKQNLNLGQGTVEEKMARLLEKMPTMARTLEVGDILKPNGTDNLRNHYGDLYSLLLQWYGSNTPKINQSFNPYNGEFADLNYAFMKDNTGGVLPNGKKYRAWAKQQILNEHEEGYKPSKQEIEDRAIQKYLYDIGGARLQSFSDFLIENSLDYFQMIGDLAAREFPMHAYSKEISFIRMFGMTGLKANMSLIPVVNRAAGKDMAGLNPDGSYAGWGDYERHVKMKGQSFIQSIGWKDAIATQLDPRYSKNVGTIAIGISKAHILKMLDDPLIRMIIPYHSSGMNPQFAKAMNIDMYTDYTDYQNTTVKQLYDLNGNKVDSLGEKAKIDMHFDINEAVQETGDPRKAAEQYVKWCAEDHPVYIGKTKVGTAKFTPAFEEFSKHRNYYKLLEDFNMYDAVTEEYAPQQAVQMNYPGGQNQLTEQQLAEYEQRLRDTGEFTEQDIQKYLQKAQMSLEDIIRAEAKSRNEYHRAADAKYDETYGQIKDALQKYSRSYSLKVDTAGRNLTDHQAEYFKDSKLRDENGALKVMYHGTPNASFTVFDSKYSEDRKSFFFTDDIEIAQSYSGQSQSYAPDRPLTFNQLKETVEYFAESDWVIEETDGGGIYIKKGELDGGDELYFNTLIGAQNYLEDTIVDHEFGLDELPANYEVYLNLKNPLIVDANGSSWNDINGETTRQIAQRAYQDGYDGVIFKQLVDIGPYSIGEKPSTVAVAFSSNQIKSVENTYPSASSDIRYALKIPENDFDSIFNEFQSEYDEMTLRDAGRILSEGARHLQDLKIDEKITTKIAGELLKKYQSNYSKAELAEQLQKLFAFIQENPDANFADVMQVTKEIAEPVIGSATEKQGVEEYERFLGVFKGHRIRLTDMQKEEVKKLWGSYAEFRRAMHGINISGSAGIDLTQFWGEIVDAMPDYFKYDTTEGDMPFELFDTLQSLTPTVKLIYGANNAEAAEDMAMSIMQQYFNEAAKASGDANLQDTANRMMKLNSEYREIIANRYDERFKQAKAELKEEYEKIGRELSSKDLKIAELKAKNSKEAAKRREKMAAEHERHVIEMAASKLQKWAMQPTATHHIPGELLEPVMEFLQSIDFVSPQIDERSAVGGGIEYYTKMYDPDQPKGHRMVTLAARTKEELYKQIAEFVESGKGRKYQRHWSEKMAAVKDLYDQVAKGTQFNSHNMDDLVHSLDKSLADDLKDVFDRNKGTLRVSQLNSDDLKVIKRAIENLSHSILVANKAFTMPSKEISALANDTMKSVNKHTARKESTKFGNRVVDFLTLDMATPKTYFSLANSDGVYKILRKALNKKIANVRKAQAEFEKIIEGVDEKTRKSWDEVKTYNIRGQEFQMNDKQLMSLYELNKRQQAMVHMPGGITITTLDVKKNGLLGKLGVKVQHTQFKPVHLTASEIKELVSNLSDQQKDIADKMQHYMATECSKWGNEAARLMYGYEKFTEENYFPIKTDRNSISMQASNVSQLYNAIADMGFTKQVKPGARNALVISDIFDVFSDHVADMATYNAYAPAIADVLRWYNFRTTDTDAANNFDHTQAVQAAIQELMGVGGKNYFSKLIRDINEQEQSSYIGGFWSNLTSKYKIAAVGANIRVVAQQPTAIVRARNLIDDKYIIRGLSAVANFKESTKHATDLSAIAWWKSQGFYESNIGPTMKKILTGDSTAIEKLQEKSLALAGLADDFGYSVLYKAVEYEQADKFKAAGLKITGEDEAAYRQAVNDRYDDVIDETQVVDSTLHRSQFMRSTDAFNKLQSAFMAEPTKSYNMLMKAASDAYKSAEGEGIKAYASVAKSKVFKRAAVSFVATNVVNAAVQSFIDAMRSARRDDDKDYWERFMAAMLENTKDDLNPANLMPWVKDVADIISNAKKQLEGESTFTSNNSRMDLAAIQNFANAAVNTIKYLQGKGSKTGFGVAYSDLQALSQLTGVPVYNLTRDVAALYDSIRHKYFYELPNIFETSTSNAKTVAKSRVFKAIDEGGDYKKAIEYAEKVGVNITVNGIVTSITNKYKDEYPALLETDPEAAAILKNRLEQVYQYLYDLNGKEFKGRDWLTDPEEAAAEENAIDLTSEDYSVEAGNTNRADGEGGYEWEYSPEDTPWFYDYGENPTPGEIGHDMSEIHPAIVGQDRQNYRFNAANVPTIMGQQRSIPTDLSYVYNENAERNQKALDHIIALQKTSDNTNRLTIGEFAKMMEDNGAVFQDVEELSARYNEYINQSNTFGRRREKRIREGTADISRTSYGEEDMRKLPAKWETTNQLSPFSPEQWAYILTERYKSKR